MPARWCPPFISIYELIYIPIYCRYDIPTISPSHWSHKPTWLSWGHHGVFPCVSRTTKTAFIKEPFLAMPRDATDYPRRTQQTASHVPTAQRHLIRIDENDLGHVLWKEHLIQVTTSMRHTTRATAPNIHQGSNRSTAGDHQLPVPPVQPIPGGSRDLFVRHRHGDNIHGDNQTENERRHGPFSLPTTEHI